MDAEERRSRFKALHAAYDHGLEVKAYLQRLQSAQPLTPVETQQRIDAYQTWFRQTMVLLNDDERVQFEFAYTGDPLKPRLQHYLTHYAEERAADALPKQPHVARLYRWSYPYSTYQRYLDEQISIVATARRRMLDGPSALPKELIPLISAPFASRNHTSLSIDGIFLSAGADRAWYVYPPRMVTGSKRKPGSMAGSMGFGSMPLIKNMRLLPVFVGL